MSAPIKLFANPSTVLPDTAKGYRVFTVEQEEYVCLPGIVSVEDVKLDGVSIPRTITEKVMSDLTDRNYHDVEIALWDVITNENGPVLIRSLKSNNGEWQIGSKVSVLGTWADQATKTGK